ncbi:hypothetical protein [Agromyces protaetiae]|uniref:hypothetical protein n=1 Tax=Agromyces protaetiae TaxID=2509455 RepID=UPI001FB5BEF5|nr:hypothetical protein [Agromyces protaetiae]
MIRAAIEASVDRIGALIEAIPADGAASDAPRRYRRAVLTTVAAAERTPDGVNLFALAVQGWSHAQTDAATQAAIAERYGSILAHWASVAQGWGLSPARAEAYAAALGAVVLGYVVERALLAEPEVEVVLSALDE